MEGLEKFKGLFERPFQLHQSTTFHLNGDIEFALFVYFRKCQEEQKEQTIKMSNLNRYEKRKLKRLGKKDQISNERT